MAMNLVAPNTGAAPAPGAPVVAGSQPQALLPILDVMPVAAPVAAPLEAGAFAVLMAAQPTQATPAQPVVEVPQAPVVAVQAAVAQATAEVQLPAAKAEDRPAADEAAAPVVPALELPTALLALWAQMTPAHAPVPQAAEIEPAPAPAKPAVSTTASSAAPLPSASTFNVAALSAPAPHGRVVEGNEPVLPDGFARHFEPVQRQIASIGDAPVAAPATSAEPLSLRGSGEQWQQPLLRALGDRLQVQIAARSEQAQIRLEPPRLGSIDIQIRNEAGQLSVAIQATHDEVVQQVREISQQLRQDLVQRHRGEVVVQVSASGEAAFDRQPEAGGGARQNAQQQQTQQQQQQRRQPGRALGEQAEEAFAAP